MAYGTLAVDTLNSSTGVLASQNGMTGIAKAWANFNGATATVRTSFNVSSITRNSTGIYTVNFTTAMATANFCANFNSLEYFNSVNDCTNVNSVKVSVSYPTNTGGAYSYIDESFCYVSVFGS